MAAVMGLLCVCVTAPAQELELDLRLREAVPHLVADKPSLNHGHTLIVPLRRMTMRLPQQGTAAVHPFRPDGRAIAPRRTMEPS